ncbi:MAG: class I SAM-dependent methyltransferase [Candidatus Enterenecus sp.]
MNRDNIETVRQYYDSAPQTEWDRLEYNIFEFQLTTWMMDKYIRPGHSVLDIGGGPGRYSIHYAQKGCAVTLAELSGGNVALAKEKAAEAGVSLDAYAVNCLELDRLGLGQFDHVFLMGPLYHLQDQNDQVEAVNIALRHLKPGGKLYVSFIPILSGMIYDLQHGGTICGDVKDLRVNCLLDKIEWGEDYSGDGFTDVCFHHSRNILPFMEQFPLDKLHLFPQEGFLAPNKVEILKRSREEIDQWIELAKRYLELPEFLSWGEHIMYIGQKRG